MCQAPAARFTADPPIRCHFTDATLREHEAWQKDKRARPEALITQIKPIT